MKSCYVNNRWEISEDKTHENSLVTGLSMVHLNIFFLPLSILFLVLFAPLVSFCSFSCLSSFSSSSPPHSTRFPPRPSCCPLLTSHSLHSLHSLLCHKNKSSFVCNFHIVGFLSRRVYCWYCWYSNNSLQIKYINTNHYCPENV